MGQSVEVAEQLTEQAASDLILNSLARQLNKPGLLRPAAPRAAGFAAGTDAPLSGAGNKNAKSKNNNPLGIIPGIK